ncbi:MAG: (E)-4-hydroxy-3-methylbut-2-enyl-diphosphate synthase [Verrucomicrobiales bacterium]
MTLPADHPLRYCPDLYRYQRRRTREVMVGNIGVGGDNPIRVQSMLTSDTRDTGACVAEALGLVEAGCEIVRVTAQTRVYAANLEHIKAGLLDAGCDVPLVADIHFKPDAALEAAKWVEKVRVNPGNYADKKKFEIREYSDDQYAEELARIEEQFAPLVRLCQERGVAMRIGTNHGSLSDRIMNRYGDTPLGMVESALEFARIARALDYHQFVFSMKASNPKVMIEAYRLLVARLDQEGGDWNYPIHLGVTEAGDGEDGRIKSAIGIGSLLADGIGDTIRVSLTEDAVCEIPAAQALVKAVLGGVAERAPLGSLHSPARTPFDPFDFRRRATDRLESDGVPVGADETIRVAIDGEKVAKLGDFQPDRAGAQRRPAPSTRATTKRSCCLAASSCLVSPPSPTASTSPRSQRSAPRGELDPAYPILLKSTLSRATTGRDPARCCSPQPTSDRCSTASATRSSSRASKRPAD